MAEADKKKTESTEEEQPKKKSKLPLILVLAVVVLGGAGAGAWFMFFSGDEPAGTEAKAAADKAPAGLVTMEPFLVNINDPEGERYAKLQLRLSVVPESQAAAIGDDALVQAKMRDRILTLLAGKSFEDLRSPLGKEAFRREIKARLDPLVENGEIQEVLFQDFVVQ